MYDTEYIEDRISITIIGINTEEKQNIFTDMYLHNISFVTDMTLYSKSRVLWTKYTEIRGISSNKKIFMDAICDANTPVYPYDTANSTNKDNPKDGIIITGSHKDL